MDDNTRHVMFGSASTEYTTPAEIFEPIADAMKLNFDAAASHENHRTPIYATKDGVFTKHFTTPAKWPVRHDWYNSDGLHTAWEGLRTWCNPPYGRGIDEWVKMAAKAVYPGNLGEGEEYTTSVAMLLPARTETEWFQRWVAPYAAIHFIMGRVRFWGHLDSCYWYLDDNHQHEGEWHEPDHPVHQLPAAPFPTVVAEYNPRLVVAQGRVYGRTWDPRTSPFEPAVPVKI